MQLSIHIELDDNASEVDLVVAMSKIGHRASNIVAAGKPMAVDEERHIDVQDLPAVWSASIFRPQ